MNGLRIERSALEQLATLLHERVGLKITPDGYYGLKLAISARLPVLGMLDADQYILRLRESTGEHELRALLPLVTVGKTDFFRDGRQFHAIETRIFPDLLKAARNEKRRALIWSAGCATGEEPYSLAMAAAELGAEPEELDIWATDLNPAAVEFARRGHYPARRMGGVSETRIRRFFSLQGAHYEVKERLRKFIRFDGLNLAAPVYPAVQPSSLDVILCRNVIIYFDQATIREVMERFLHSLRPGGVLLLGYSESLFRVYDRFEMFEVDGSFAYRRPFNPQPKPPRLSAADLARNLARDLENARRPAAGKSVPAEVKRATEVVRSAATERPNPPAVAGPSLPPLQPPTSLMGRSPVERLNAAVLMMERGQFSPALAALIRLAEDEPNDLASLLTLGNVYSLTGQTAQARDAFALALAREPLCVEGRVYGAVAALQANLLDDARAELVKALFLEPTLALGHYLLGQVQERLGEREGARRSYRNAVAQLGLPQRVLAGYYPDMPESVETVVRAARYALAAVEEEA